MIIRSEKIKRIVLATVVGSIIITTLGSTANALTVDNVNLESSITEGSYINAEDESIIENLRNKWKEDLIGGELINLDNETIGKKISGYVKTTKNLLSTLSLELENNWLWDNLKDYKETPAQITTMYKNIVSMAMAYNLPNDTYYKNEDLRDKIIYALEWVNKNAYNDTQEEYGNWWEWMIGTPASLNNAVILMYDDLTPEQIERYMSAIQKFLPSIDPESNKNHTGANLADVCLNKLLQGINLKDSEKIQEASVDISSVFEYVNNGDGFYSDGSFLQHGIVAYTGSYGNVLIDKVSNLMYILEGTPWSMKSENKGNIYKWIFESFDPIIYKGYVMDMVRGRSISRHNGDGYIQSSGIIEGMIKISMISEGDMAKKIQSLVKQWAEEASDVIDFGTKFKSINVINKFYEIMNDSTIVSAVQGSEHNALNMMDKTIHEREDYALAIARSSSRISKYEFMNKENLKPWFQGDGMTYLHNGDLTQFSDNFWATIDPYRMPGTTIDKRERAKKEILPGIEPSSPLQDEVYYELGNSNWSGGTKLGSYGVAGMQIDNKYDSLKANKSWFMFDDETVALGSGITNIENFKNETIIENRKIRKDGSNKFIVDGLTVVDNLGDISKVDDAKWAYLEGNGEGSDIGYYFPTGANIDLLREYREGNWFNINESKVEADKVVTNNYLTMYIDHGSNIENEKYSYVLLPGKSSEEVERYSEDPSIEILRNDEMAHGVKHKGLKMEGANFWTDEENTSGFITSDSKASVMIKENEDNTLTIVVSDPTFEQDDISIEIEKLASRVISSDNEISDITLEEGKIVFDVDTLNSNGKTFELVVELDESSVIQRPDQESKPKKVKGKSTKDTVKLTWEEPKNSEDLIGYIIYKDGKELIIIESENEEYIVENLNSNTNYGFEIVAKYSNNEISKPVSINIRTKK